MGTRSSKRRSFKTNDAVTAWLMDSDPAIRWQVMQDLIDAPAEQIATKRSQVPHNKGQFFGKREGG